MDKQLHTLSLILTATVSMAVGAGLMYYKNRDEIKFMKQYPQYLEMQELMKDTDTGLPGDPGTEVVFDSYLRLYDDKYTYVEREKSPIESSLDRVNGSPAACGMGFQVEYSEEKGYYFSDITEGMPAADQGLEVGDVICEINGNSFSAENDKFIRDLICKEGTALNITILRNGTLQAVTLNVICDEYAAGGVSSQRVGDVLVIGIEKVSSFAPSYVKELIAANAPSALIFDLRQNPGGETDSAIKISDMFIDGATMNVTQKVGKTIKYSTEDGKDFEIPIVVLVDENTASAAEIITAFLKQYANAQIVGENTFGKGLIQNYATLDGYSIKYTTGTFTVGDWPCWQGVGIAPDIEVKMDPDLIGTDEDIQLQKALEILG